MLPSQPKRQKTRAEVGSRSCKWLCMCKSDQQQRKGVRGGGHIACAAECPKARWMRDPGWPQAPTVPDVPAIGTRCSFLPCAGRSGVMEYRGRGLGWVPVEPTAPVGV
eukprot:2062963-Prymnesium_polylepis.1